MLKSPRGKRGTIMREVIPGPCHAKREEREYKDINNFSFHGRAAQSPNDPKLSDRGVRRGTCMVGGKAAAEAGAVTHGAVRCSAWLGVAVILEWASQSVV